MPRLLYRGLGEESPTLGQHSHPTTRSTMCFILILSREYLGCGHRLPVQNLYVSWTHQRDKPKPTDALCRSTARGRCAS